MPTRDKNDERSTFNRRRKFIILGVLFGFGVASLAIAIGLTNVKYDGLLNTTEANMTTLQMNSTYSPCLDDSCLNGGTCSGSMDVFTCDCVDGYHGATCQEDTDECISSPCQMNGTCDDRINGYECQCSDGYEGFHCEIETNECQSNPCHNDALCVDLFNGYWCDYCWNYDICFGGVCINEPAGSFTCDCSAEGELVNIALGKTVTQSSTANENGIAEHAVDGDKSGNWLDNSCSHTSGLYNEPWWRVDLAEIHCISRVVITNRQDCCSHKIETAVVLITNTVDEVDAIQCGSAIDQATALQATISFECDENTLGRYVTVDKTETPVVLHMCEIEVFAPMML
uniref:Protein jagged-1b-like n=1 Tax=Saccoglossus kowalevskii TaxID=10224 RepID=A0ABM0MBQ3_SACKO|nr:PREDICTED: protein jagged-1b-like [Saccoglossus kowalevskii]